MVWVARGLPQLPTHLENELGPFVADLLVDSPHLTSAEIGRESEMTEAAIPPLCRRSTLVSFLDPSSIVGHSFSSISANEDSVYEVLKSLHANFSKFLPLYLPNVHFKPLELGKPTWKATPWSDSLVGRFPSAREKYTKMTSIFVNVYHEIEAIRRRC